MSQSCALCPLIVVIRGIWYTKHSWIMQSVCSTSSPAMISPLWFCGSLSFSLLAPPHGTRNGMLSNLGK
jgi:hypothetical protein